MIKEVESHSLDRAIQAFNDHLPITVRKMNGEVFGPGYIMIMYGEIAFRIQLENVNDSFFIRTEEIAEIDFG
jgi:hypothetical protein